MRLVAQRIRELAMEHDVPIVERPELARAMYKAVEVGDSVPEKFFRAVAEVLAFVYQIDRRVEKVREREQMMAAQAQQAQARQTARGGMTRPSALTASGTRTGGTRAL
jgi:hypothetical protein